VSALDRGNEPAQRRLGSPDTRPAPGSVTSDASRHPAASPAPVLTADMAGGREPRCTKSSPAASRPPRRAPPAAILLRVLAALPGGTVFRDAPRSGGIQKPMDAIVGELVEPREGLTVEHEDACPSREFHRPRRCHALPTLCLLPDFSMYDAPDRGPGPEPCPLLAQPRRLLEDNNLKTSVSRVAAASPYDRHPCPRRHDECGSFSGGTLHRFSPILPPSLSLYCRGRMPRADFLRRLTSVGEETSIALPNRTQPCFVGSVTRICSAALEKGLQLRVGEILDDQVNPEIL
jgi:hypothetical protein